MRGRKANLNPNKMKATNRTTVYHNIGTFQSLMTMGTYFRSSSNWHPFLTCLRVSCTQVAFLFRLSPSLINVIVMWLHLTNHLHWDVMDSLRSRLASLFGAISSVSFDLLSCVFSFLSQNIYILPEDFRMFTMRDYTQSNIYVYNFTLHSTMSKKCCH